MTVAELMEMLKAYDPDTTVMVAGYEGGFSKVKYTKYRRMVYDPNPYCGDYEDGLYTDKHGDTIPVVVIV